MNSPKPIKIALLGLGRAGQFQLQSIRSLSAAVLRHAVDIDGERAKAVAAEFGCSHATNAGASLADPEVNAVIIATPTGEHFEQITAALNAGKAVFTEKPLGDGLEEIDTCFKLAHDKNLPLFVGFNRRFDPSYSSLAERVRHGDIGSPQMLRVTSRDSPLPSMDYISTSHGIFHDCIVHDLDMLRFIIRENPIEIYSIGSTFVDEIKALDDLDNVLVTLKYASGLLASIDVNRFASYGYDQRVEAFGTKGMLQAENRSPISTVLANGDGLQRPPIEYSFPTRYRDAYRIELETFIDCVQNGTPTPITHEDVRTSFLLCELAEKSYREGKPLEFAKP